MNDQFDELARGLAQSVTRRAALKKFGVGLAAVVLASLGLANKAEANQKTTFVCNCSGTVAYFGCDPQGRKFDRCVQYCAPRCT